MSEVVSPTPLAHGIFAAFDAKDVPTLVAAVTDDVRLRLGNSEPAEGKPAFAEGVQTFVDSVAGFRHHVLNVWSEGDVVIAELEVDYIRHDGKELTLPCCNVFRVRNGLVADYRVYMDISPVYA